jgi:tetratricopeptide (TPR) repeat protein
MQVSNDIPENLPGIESSPAEEAKGLMIMMSFTEWLNHFKSRKEKEAEEAQGQKAVKTMWQKEKLAAALEEENEEIPEKVFEMAVNSITNEDDLVSESLAEVHSMQGRHDKAIEMYRKLSLRNPQKKAYFARKIEVILKDKQS